VEATRTSPNRRSLPDRHRTRTDLVAGPSARQRDRKSLPSPGPKPGFVKTLRTEWLDHVVIFGERHLRHLLTEFIAHYHTERYQQGLGGQIIRRIPSLGNDNGLSDSTQCRSRLGGLLSQKRRTSPSAAPTSSPRGTRPESSNPPESLTWTSSFRVRNSNTSSVVPSTELLSIASLATAVGRFI
jgi:hypothetical protein